MLHPISSQPKDGPKTILTLTLKGQLIRCNFRWLCSAFKKCQGLLPPSRKALSCSLRQTILLPYTHTWSDRAILSLIHRIGPP